ncbi:hypothetical protein Agabi119p4_5195 [Agaricus bisporus var. burnettii]|uniref:Uncharacterized protein n=1 Tax=Agaricus bisporus var. burnettii TaxID=192524 RepID=A0A8H7F4T4_AGABI|nr:hypothetical protein Agabi119p4_5195 [Agaricus bisporus var. burnettii]
MASILPLDDDDDKQAFIASEWIGVGKKYSFGLPGYVQHAKNVAIAIPDHFDSYFPSDNLPVLQFLALPLVKESAAAVSVKVQLWFSEKTPTVDPKVLYTRDVPDSKLLKDLRSMLPQAWLDGAKSISDPRQDSKHALKTIRNNLFSGSRLLVLGNHVASYSHIHQAAHTPGSPLYHRDVEKVDRQDDNAATRLFSSSTLEFLCRDDLRDSMTGVIIYLFVFGDAIDAYQSRSISCEERLQSLLRLRFFIDGWLLFLSKSQYPKSSYTISREALDIIKFIIEGYIGLVFIFRDHLLTSEPLLPWLHSTESCEHTFGQARQIVKDFTYLDFLHMIPKLRVKMRQENLVVAQSIATSKLPANGYTHTYFHTLGLDLFKLSRFPSDSRIQDLATTAMDEADSLLSVLGINPFHLHSIHAPNMFPSIDTWFLDTEIDDTLENYDDDDQELEGARLNHLIHLADNLHRTRLTNEDDDRLLGLTCASLALTAQDTIDAYQIDDTLSTSILALVVDERREVSVVSKQLRLPPVQLDEPSHPLGTGDGQFTIHDFDLSLLCTRRRDHQPEYAKHCARTRDDQKEGSSEESIKQQLIREFHKVLREDESSLGTAAGIDRRNRWTGNPGYTPVAATGNAKNAAAAASKAATKAAAHRSEILRKHNIPVLHLVLSGSITLNRPLKVGDYAFLFVEGGIHVGKIMFFYSKLMGKNSPHALITSSPGPTNISALSNIAIQVYRHFRGQQFSSITQATAIFHTAQFLLLPPQHFLTVLVSKPHTITESGFSLGSDDYTTFGMLRSGITSISRAVKELSKKDTS